MNAYAYTQAAFLAFGLTLTCGCSGLTKQDIKNGATIVGEIDDTVICPILKETFKDDAKALADVKLACDSADATTTLPILLAVKHKAPAAKK